ncbi:MAG: YmdB family metallophosphoesterase [Deltaproteobacteria bacterium]|nr:YmdB family metallophosphoesterase [Deltaproteobacteria bacterium]
MPADAFTALLLGDVFGKPGRQALAKQLPSILEQTGARFTIANAENASGGIGLTPEVADELLGLGIDVLTSGNHIWKHKEIRPYLDGESRLLRPANYPSGSPGRGARVFSGPESIPIGVVNLQGLLFMDALACPFRTADDLLHALHPRTRIILVDFHAEATSEKRAMGHYLDGRVTAIVGTHTHIPTADAEILPGGTGYLSDLGMCGPTDSVIGVRKESAIQRFTTRLPHPFQVARKGLQIQGALVRIDPDSGSCLDISQRSWPVDADD